LTIITTIIILVNSTQAKDCKYRHYITTPHLYWLTMKQLGVVMIKILLKVYHINQLLISSIIKSTNTSIVFFLLSFSFSRQRHELGSSK